MGAGALEDLRELGRRCFALVLLHPAARAEGPTGRTPWGTEALGTRTKRWAFGPRPRRGYALERARGHELGLHGGGRGRRHVQWTHLLASRPRDACDGGLPGGPHALRCLDPLQRGLAEGFVR